MTSQSLVSPLLDSHQPPSHFCSLRLWLRCKSTILPIIIAVYALSKTSILLCSAAKFGSLCNGLAAYFLSKCACRSVRWFDFLCNDCATLQTRKNAFPSMEHLKRRMDTGARDRDRTDTPPFGKAADFKSAVSTNFTTRAA